MGDHRGEGYVSERKHGGGALRRREPRVARWQVYHTSTRVGTRRRRENNAIVLGFK